MGGVTRPFFFMCVALDVVKSYLRVDHTEEDDLIEQLIKAATQMVETRLKRPVIGVEENALAQTIETVPESVKIAVCTAVAFMYENRTATDEEVRSRVLRSILLDQYIDWGA